MSNQNRQLRSLYEWASTKAQEESHKVFQESKNSFRESLSSGRIQLAVDRGLARQFLLDTSFEKLINPLGLTLRKQIEQDTLRIKSLNQLLEKSQLTQKEFEEIDNKLAELRKRGGPLTDKSDFDFVDTVENASGEFGYQQTNPIPVDNPDGEQSYIESLQCECGVPFLYRREGVIGTGPDGHLLDLYILVCKNFNHRLELYFDMYHGDQSQLIPKGTERGTKRGCSIEEHLQKNPTDRTKLERLIQGK